MKTSVKPLLLAGLLAACTLAAQAHPGSAAAPGVESAPSAGQHAERHTRMQEHMARRAAELKARLQLSPEQESSWSTYLAALQPANPGARPERGEISRLSTPERLDKMRELRRQHEAEFDRRDAATRSFYASLSAPQQKVFDENTARAFHPGHREGKR